MKITLEDYMDFYENRSEHNLVCEKLNQIISSHGFLKIHHNPKSVILEAVRSLDPLMAPNRSTLKESISSSAFLSLKEVRDDLNLLDWNECPLQSILTTQSSVTEDEDDLPSNLISPASSVQNGEKLKKRRYRKKKNQLVISAASVAEVEHRLKKQKQKQKKNLESSSTSLTGNEIGGKLKNKRKRRFLGKLVGDAVVAASSSSTPPPPSPLAIAAAAAAVTPETMAEKEGGIVSKGHDEGMRMATSLLERFDLPLGLLPLEDVIEVGFVESTGYMWIVQQKKIEHSYKMISKLVSYDTEIHGYVDKKRITKLKGVKAKEFLLWPPINEIIVDDPPTGKIHFKSLAGVTKTFPIEAFAVGQ